MGYRGMTNNGTLALLVCFRRNLPCEQDHKTDHGSKNLDPSAIEASCNHMDKSSGTHNAMIGWDGPGDGPQARAAQTLSHHQQKRA